MCNDESWIRNLRKAGREYETFPVPGLWEELEGELFAAHVARRPVWISKVWYVAASVLIAAVASVYIICGRHIPDEAAPVLTIFASSPSAGEKENIWIDEEVGAALARNERRGSEIAMVSSERGEQPAAQSEAEGYGKFSYYERIIVVENGPDPMNNECVMVSVSTDGKAPDNSYPVKENCSKGIGGRLYASVSGARLSGGVPVSAGATVEIPLADRLRLETGLEYTGVRAGGSAGSYLGVPVRVSYDIYDREGMRVYASAGGAVDKSLNRRDVSMSLDAAVGIEYSIDDNWGVFVEPGVDFRPGNGGSMPGVCGDRQAAAEVRVGFRHTFH